MPTEDSQAEGRARGRADHWIKVKKPDDMTVGHRDLERFSLPIVLDSEKVFAPWSRI